MMGGDTPWILYFCGAVLALLLNWLGVPALAFCLGMFIPLSLNTPMLVGGAIAWFVAHSSKDKATADARRDRGTLIASGLIAGVLCSVYSPRSRLSSATNIPTRWTRAPHRLSVWSCTP